MSYDAGGKGKGVFGFIKSTIGGFIEKGYDYTRAAFSYIASGFSTSIQEVQTEFLKQYDEFDAASRIQLLEINDHISDDFMGLSFRQSPNDYLFIGKVSFIDPQSQQEVTIFHRFETDYLTDMDSMLDDFKETVKETSPELADFLTDVSFVRAYRYVEAPEV